MIDRDHVLSLGRQAKALGISRSALLLDLARPVPPAFAALIERRPYKNPLGSEEAFAILAGMTGKLDRAMLEAFRPVSVAAA